MPTEPRHAGGCALDITVLSSDTGSRRGAERGRPPRSAGSTAGPQLSDREFALFRNFLYEVTGINLSEAKRALVCGRLAKRVKELGLSSYGEYFDMLAGDSGGERQAAVDLLTTNETFFFREPTHFDFLRDRVLCNWTTGPRRVWSAACSSGEEAYTLAMVLAEHSPTDTWEVVGTDISTRVLERARSGRYPMQRAGNIPARFLHRYCLRGIGSQEGTFLVDRALRARVSFVHANLKSDLSKLGSFDVILLRNVLIYFDLPTKQEVVARVLRQLRPGGYLLVGHSESLNGVTDEASMVTPSVYRKP